MATNPINSTSNYFNTETGRTREPKQELGKDEFLQILAVQLANQDPLEPMSDTDFIAQMAQFSSLEQMQALNTTFNATQAYSLIGKDILGKIYDEVGGEAQIFGRVTGVMNVGGENYLTVGEYLVPVSAVSDVFDNGVAQDTLLTQAANLIGKQVDMEVPYAEGEKPEGAEKDTETVSGEVEYVLVKNGTLYAKLKDTETMKDKEVPVAYISKIY